MSSADSARTYYDTTREVERLKEYEQKAGLQEKAVLRYFRTRPGQLISPSTCHEGLILLGCLNSNVPLTSIRRAITNLTKAGFLQKVDEKTCGAYGRAEFCWTFVDPLSEPKQLRLL